MKRNANVPQRDVTFRPVRYHIEDLPYIRGKILVGMKFCTEKRQEDGSGCLVHYTIVEKYPYHASCINQYGQRRSFGYFELDQILSGV